jgi:hypothetical protein
LFDISTDSAGFVKFGKNASNRICGWPGPVRKPWRIMAENADVQNGIWLLLRHERINKSARIQGFGA